MNQHLVPATLAATSRRDRTRKSMMKRRLLLATALLFALATPSLATAAVILVTTDLDTDAADGECSIREAILAANSDQFYQECPAGSGDDRIAFSLTPPVTIRLTDDLPTITASLRIGGPDSDLVSIDGANSFSILELDSPQDDAVLIVEGLTLERGNSHGALIKAREMAIFRRVRFEANQNLFSGGGLGTFADARVTVEDCWFLDNFVGAQGSGGGISAANGVELTVRGSTFSGNRVTANNRHGGGISCEACELVIERSTFSGNESAGAGGGLFVRAVDGIGGSLVLRNSTLVGNTSGDGSGTGRGGGVAFSSLLGAELPFHLENTVLAKNLDLNPTLSRPDISCSTNPSLVSTGSSFVSNHTGCESLLPEGNPNADGNFVGTAAASLSPQLDILHDLGGETPVHMPLLSPLSPLLDQGSCANAAADQRGYGAPSGGRAVDLPGIGDPGGDGCDIGAVEFDAVAIPLPEIFRDGFETGTTLLWTGAVE